MHHGTPSLADLKKGNRSVSFRGSELTTRLEGLLESQWMFQCSCPVCSGVKWRAVFVDRSGIQLHSAVKNPVTSTVRLSNIDIPCHFQNSCPRGESETSPSSGILSDNACTFVFIQVASLSRQLHMTVSPAKSIHTRTPVQYRCL